MGLLAHLIPLEALGSPLEMSTLSFSMVVWRERWFLESEMEMLLLISDPDLPGQLEIYNVVEDMISTLQAYVHQDCTIAVEPFDSRIGKCAVIQDAFGTRFRILEKTGKRSEKFSIIWQSWLLICFANLCPFPC